jgi:hypothetical protein
MPGVVAVGWADFTLVITSFIAPSFSCHCEKPEGDEAISSVEEPRREIASLRSQ